MKKNRFTHAADNFSTFNLVKFFLFTEALYKNSLSAGDASLLPDQGSKKGLCCLWIVKIA